MWLFIGPWSWLRANVRGVVSFEIQLEFGAIFAIEFGPLHADARITAGIYLLCGAGGRRVAGQMGDKEDEAAAWPGQSAVAKASVDFANAFLGLRKDGNKDTKLEPSDITRLMDIVRAVSWVESRHGTGTGEQPARDPMQCGNPKDPWWKELTGQTEHADRFVRGPGLSNLDADELPDEAEGANGFDSDASLKMLGSEVKKGHGSAKFTKKHSYFWAVPILIHKMNTNEKVKDPTYQCGDLSRDRLVDGAFWYNGKGDDDYRSNIDNALNLFGGLQDSIERSRSVISENRRIQIERALDAGSLRYHREVLEQMELCARLMSDSSMLAGLSRGNIKAVQTALSDWYLALSASAAAQLRSVHASDVAIPKPGAPSNAQAVVDACEAQFDDHSKLCNGFVRAVCDQFNKTKGDFGANDDADKITNVLMKQQKNWLLLADGIEAFDAANSGKLVLAGALRTSYDPPRPHGHVVVVVSSSETWKADDHKEYPYGYWGDIDGNPQKKLQLSQAFNHTVRDKNKVVYACKII